MSNIFIECLCAYIGIGIVQTYFVVTGGREPKGLFSSWPGRIVHAIFWLPLVGVAILSIFTGPIKLGWGRFSCIIHVDTKVPKAK